MDYRPGARIRVSPHFYATDEEVERAVAEIAEIVRTGAYRKHLAQRGPTF